ncbi:YncE family protein [Pseudonocardia saturnea]
MPTVLIAPARASTIRLDVRWNVIQQDEMWTVRYRPWTTAGPGAVDGSPGPPRRESELVAHRLGDKISVIETATHTVPTTVADLGDPADVAISPDGRRAFVANRTAGTVSVIGIG